MSVNKSSCTVDGKSTKMAEVEATFPDDEDSAAEALEELIRTLGLEDEFGISEEGEIAETSDEEGEIAEISDEEPAIAEDPESEVKVEVPAEADVKPGDKLVVEVGEEKDPEDPEGEEEDPEEEDKEDLEECAGSGCEKDEIESDEFLEELFAKLKESKESIEESAKSDWKDAKFDDGTEIELVEATTPREEPKSIEDSTELKGADCAVKSCEGENKLVAHCAEEKPDCKVEKKVLDKPLAGDNVDSDFLVEDFPEPTGEPMSDKDFEHILGMAVDQSTISE